MRPSKVCDVNWGSHFLQQREQESVFTCCFENARPLCRWKLHQTLQIQKEAFSCTIPFYGDSRPEVIKWRKKWLTLSALWQQIGSPLSILQCVLNTSSQMTTSISSPFCQKWAANPQYHDTRGMESFIVFRTCWFISSVGYFAKPWY